MSIFLSYRRADSAHALWLYPWLIQWFGSEQVFWDRKDIDPGANFAEVIEQQIRSSRAFVALVSTNWLWAVDEQGRRSIDSPKDWIRRETVLALCEGLLMIPVLVGDMKAPRAQDLPDDLQKLSEIQMLSAGDMRFYDLLRERLEDVIGVDAHGPGKDDEQSMRLQRRAGSLLRRQIGRLQVRAVELIQDRKLDRATEELNEGSELLMALLDLLPGDPTLDAQLGYLFLKTGQAFSAAGGEEQTDDYLDLALSVFERVKANPEVFHKRPWDLASAIKGIGEVYYERGDPVKAIEHYRAAIDIDPQYFYAWHDMFLAYTELAKRGEIHLDALREAFEKTKLYGGNLPGMGMAQFRLLENELARFDPVQAMDVLQRSQAEDNKEGMAMAYENLGRLAADSANYQEAEKWTREALLLCEELGDPRRLARAYWAMAGIQVRLENAELASEFYGKARALYEELGDEKTVSKIDSAMSTADQLAVVFEHKQRERAELEEIIRSTGSALEMYTRDQNPVEWASTMHSRGLAFHRLGGDTNLKEAIHCYDLVLEVIPRERFPTEWARIMKSRGEAYRELGGANTEEAIRAYDLALEVLTREQYPEEWARLMMNRGLAWQFPGEGGTTNLEEAVRCYNLATEVYTCESNPSDWERMMFNRGAACSDLRGPDRAAKLKEAIRSYQAVVDAQGNYAVVAAAALAASLEELSRIPGTDTQIQSTA